MFVGRVMHVTLRFFIFFMSFATFGLAYRQNRKREDIENEKEWKKDINL